MFKPASKQLAKAKILLTGPSGSGKTFSALRLARGLGGKTAVIDTENNSASLYADQFPGWTYNVASLSPPYTAQKYFQAIEEAERQKFDILIIDSATHLWAGEGGLLDQKSAADSRGGNSFTNWNAIGKLNETFKSKVLHSPIHVICTARSKQEYIIEANEKGKQTPKKVGLAPILRDGMEYEFTVVFDIGMDHQFIVTKDRTNLFNQVVDTLTEKTGEKIKHWLADDIKAEPVTDFLTDAASKEEQIEEETQSARSFTKQELEAFKSSFKGTIGAAKIAQAVHKKETRIAEQARFDERDPAPDELDVALAGESPLDYTISFGKFSGKTIRQVGVKEVGSYLDWMLGQAKGSGKNLTPSAEVLLIKLNEVQKQSNQR